MAAKSTLVLMLMIAAFTTYASADHNLSISKKFHKALIDVRDIEHDYKLGEEPGVDATFIKSEIWKGLQKIGTEALTRIATMSTCS